MKNTLFIKTLPNGCVQTEILMIDGVSVVEMYPAGIYESTALKKILERDYYQHIKGTWEVSFPDDNWRAENTTFEKIIEDADRHIFDRDNSSNIDYNGFC